MDDLFSRKCHYFFIQAFFNAAQLEVVICGSKILLK